MASRKSDRLLCPICLGQFERPSSLPCLHTFCTSCLRAHVDSVAQGALFSLFLCPVCRANTRPPRPFSSRDQWADQFPVNYWILSEIEEQQSRDDEIELHCDQHADLMISLFCTDHQQQGCALCVATKHRKCDDVVEIETLVKSKDLVEECECLKTIIDRLEKKSQSKKDIADTSAKRLGDRRELLENEIRTVVDGAVTKLRRAEAALLAEVDTFCGHVTADINETKTDSERGLALCSGTRAMLQTISPDLDPTNKFIKIQKAKEKLQEHSHSLVDREDSLNDGGIIDRIHFEINQTFCEAKASECIGKLDSNPVQILTDRPVEEPNEAQFQQTSQPEKCPQSDMPCAEARDTGYFTSSTASTTVTTTHAPPRESWITSATAMKHKTFLVNDHKHSSLKLIKEGVIVFEFRTEQFWGITKVSDSLIAVYYSLQH